MSSELIDHNPMLKKPILLTLSICADLDGASRLLIEERAGESWEASFTHAPASVIDALIRSEYVTEQITVDGVAYNGTLEEAYRDDGVPDDAEVDALLGITESGKAVIASYAPEKTLAELIDSRPAYVTVFNAVLSACDSSDGASRDALEAVIDATISGNAISAADGGKIYPQYFLDALETAGGISWNGAWRTTEAGRAAINS